MIHRQTERGRARERQMCIYVYIYVYTPGSINSLFGDLFRKFWRVILGGVRDYLGVDLGGSLDSFGKVLKGKFGRC